MKKLRIVEHHGVYYPERRLFFLWFRFDRLPLPEGGISTSGSKGIGFFKLSEARKSLSIMVEQSTPVIHKPTERWSVEHDD